MTGPLESEWYGASLSHPLSSAEVGEMNEPAERQRLPCMQRTKNKRLTAKLCDGCGKRLIEQSERPRHTASMDRRTKHHRAVVAAD